MEREEALRRLREPFDIELLEWKPQVVSKEKDTAIAAVYADTRAYSDRLNEVFGPDGWSESYDIKFVNFSYTEEPWTKAGEPKQPAVKKESCKMVVTCTLTIGPYGSHSDVGEGEVPDDNVATSTCAQAFKRACVRFGLGRYLYDFPRSGWIPYDSKKKIFTSTPPIPDWAVPKKNCSDCSKEIEAFSYKKEGKDVTVSASEVVRRGKERYGLILCVPCQKVRTEVSKTASGGRL
jgi:hypothetical protein